MRHDRSGADESAQEHADERRETPAWCSAGHGTRQDGIGEEDEPFHATQPCWRSSHASTVPALWSPGTPIARPRGHRNTAGTGIPII